METKIELEKAITEITSTISRDFPELNKFILEMPLGNAGDQEVTIKSLKDYHQSLLDIVTEYCNATSDKEDEKPDAKEFPGYPLYPDSEDIYKNSKEEKDLNPEDTSKKKTANEDADEMNHKSFQEDMSGDDLDVPGSELDDQQEKIGSEDEENNYYSLGGDNHNDLEEDKG